MALVPLPIERGTITNSSHVCCRHYSQQHCAFVSDVLVSPPPWREILSRGATHNCIADKYHLTVMFTFVGASCSPFGRSICLFLVAFSIKVVPLWLLPLCSTLSLARWCVNYWNLEAELIYPLTLCCSISI